MAQQLPTSREDLAALVKGQSDENINAVVAEVGVDTVLQQVFTGMQEQFNAEAAAGRSATLQWVVEAPEGVQSFAVHVADGACTVEEGVADKADVTFTLSLADFVRFTAGELDGMSAFMSGKLKVAGDIMLAQSIQTWFA